jgi:Na+/glutamate symporter
MLDLILVIVIVALAAWYVFRSFIKSTKSDNNCGGSCGHSCSSCPSAKMMIDLEKKVKSD